MTMTLSVVRTTTRRLAFALSRPFSTQSTQHKQTDKPSTQSTQSTPSKQSTIQSNQSTPRRDGVSMELRRLVDSKRMTSAVRRFQRAVDQGETGRLAYPDVHAFLLALVDSHARPSAAFAPASASLYNIVNQTLSACAHFSFRPSVLNALVRFYGSIAKWDDVMAVYAQLQARSLLPIPTTSIPPIIDALANRGLFDQAEHLFRSSWQRSDAQRGAKMAMARAIMVAYSKQNALDKASDVLNDMLRLSPDAATDGRQFSYVSFLQCAANVNNVDVYDTTLDTMRSSTGPLTLQTLWSLVTQNAVMLGRHAIAAQLIDEAKAALKQPVFQVQPGDMPPLGKPLIALVNQACEYRRQLPVSGAFPLTLIKSIDPTNHILSHDTTTATATDTATAATDTPPFALDHQAVTHAERYFAMFQSLYVDPFKQYTSASDSLIQTIQNPVFTSTNPLAVRVMNATPTTHMHRLRGLFVPRTTPFLAMAHVYELAGMREKAIKMVLEASEVNVVGAVNLKRVFEKAPAVADKLAQELKEQHKLAEPKVAEATSVDA